jgi:hypothetical protein
MDDDGHVCTFYDWRHTGSICLRRLIGKPEMHFFARCHLTAVDTYSQTLS